jgi:hypothetical protein
MDTWLPAPTTLGSLNESYYLGRNRLALQHYLSSKPLTNAASVYFMLGQFSPFYST